MAAHCFEFEGSAVDVERGTDSWRLTRGGQIVESRDLSSGIEQLLGKSRSNMTLVLQILEWHAVDRPPI
jgi:hypothetical protein